MTENFVHTSYASRVVFGAGTLEQVAAEVELLGVRRALVIATGSARQAADVVEAVLKERFAGRIDGVRQHVPTEVADAARAKAREVGADGVVAIGGGSAIGLAKAIALTADVQILAVPTTYAGSEMTPVWGETSGGSKTTGTDLRVLPKTVVYDPQLTLATPAQRHGGERRQRTRPLRGSRVDREGEPDHGNHRSRSRESVGGRAAQALRPSPDQPARGELPQPAASCCSALASPVRRSPRPAPVSTTSSATSSAAPTTSPTPRLTPQYSPKSPG